MAKTIDEMRKEEKNTDLDTQEIREDDLLNNYRQDLTAQHGASRARSWPHRAPSEK